MTSCCCCAIVSQSNVGIMEQVGGQFDDVVPPGMNCFNPCAQKFSGVQSLRAQLIRCDLQAISKDRASVFVKVAIIFKAIPSQVHRSYYSMTGASDQIRSFVVSSLRGLLPEKTLDEVFLERDQIALAIRQSLSETLRNYGFELIDVLMEDVDVRGSIRDSMNQQVFQRYNRVVEQYRGDIQKIQSIKKAEGEAEASRLRGIGTALERDAITTAFRQGMEGFERNGEVSETELTALVLMTQYFDMIHDIGKNKKTKPVSYFFPLHQGQLDKTELRARMKRTLQATTTTKKPIDASDL